jgi:hypothetical protein
MQLVLKSGFGTNIIFKGICFHVFLEIMSIQSLRKFGKMRIVFPWDKNLIMWGLWPTKLTLLQFLKFPWEKAVRGFKPWSEGSRILLNIGHVLGAWEE